MKQKNIKIKAKEILKYLSFVFAFVCCWFVFSSCKVSAAPTISIPTDDSFDYDEGLEFYVGYDVSQVNTLKYSFDGGTNWTNIANPASSYVSKYDSSSEKKPICALSYVTTCTSTILKYKITLPSVPASVDENGKFTITIYAKNSAWFGNETTKTSESLTYDGSGGVVNSISVSGVSKYAVSGDELKFQINFNEHVKTTSNVVWLKFKIGTATKSTLCPYSSNDELNNVIKCSYTVNDSDNGSISYVEIVNYKYIVDKYGNAMTNGSLSGLTSSSVTVDTVGPKVTSIVADEGTFIAGDTVGVEITFSEKLVKTSKNVIPVLTVKFGSGSNKVCTYNSGANEKLIYSCSVSESDQGALRIVSLTNNTGFSDSAGNLVNLSVSSYSFLKTNADNQKPGVDSVSVSVSDCLSGGSGKYYCVVNKKIVLKFKFNKAIDVSSSSTKFDVTLYFGGVQGKGSVSKEYDSTNNQYLVTYLVSTGDNGVLSLNYKFNLVCESGKTNYVEDSASYTYYAENDVPVVGSFEVYKGNDMISGNAINGKEGDKFVFKAVISDSSSVSIADSTKIDLIDSNGASVCNSYNGYKCSAVTLSDRVISIELTIDGNLKSGIKLKVGKGAIKDAVNNVSNADYYSNEYIVDSLNPVYSIEIKYPEYKGYEDNGKFVLTSGNTIDFVITSTDTDLKEYCIYLNNDSSCTYNTLQLNSNLSYVFEDNGDKEYSFYIKVVDVAGNYSSKKLSFVLKNLFSYSNGVGSIATMHSITFNTSILSNGEMFKYGWFRKNSTVSFNDASTSAKDSSNQFVINGNSSFNGDYRVCVFVIANSGTLCSEYVSFDTKIDEYEVEVSSQWSKSSVIAKITFNDTSAIKCIAVGENVSDLSCSSDEEGVVINKTSQINNPFEYIIDENGVYYFYIEDTVGNNEKVSKTINNIDKDSVLIELFNGNSSGNDTNLDESTYKNNHKFLTVFDKGVSNGSPVAEYKYFFSKSSYTISNVDSFNGYYLNSVYKNSGSNVNSVMISAPNSENGTFNLYIMVIDGAGNVSFESLVGINIDIQGPLINMYDVNGNSTNGGSSVYVSKIEGSFEIKEVNGKLNLNYIYYKWINASNNAVVYEKKYESCSFDYNVCVISGSEIELDSSKFDPSASYKLVVYARDDAGNQSEFTTYAYKLDTTPPVVEIIVEDKWYTTNSFTFTVSKTNNTGTLNSISYCLNDCLVDEKYDMDKFKSLVVVNPTSDTKNLVLGLSEGVNTLYIYASDVFGNYVYSVNEIKYDSKASIVSVNNADANGKVNLSGVSEEVIDFTIVDVGSGVKNYCIFLNGTQLECANVGELLADIKYPVTINGEYTIKVFDFVGHSYEKNVSVVGIDKEPISFDLITDVSEGKYTNKDVLISIVNMRKYMSEDVSSNVQTIDYISTSEELSDYSGLFESCTSIYNRNVDDTLVTSFEVSVNKIYVVRIVDTAGNISFKSIKIECIDKVSPFINHDLLNGADRVYLTTISGSNIVKVNGNYKYSNETLQIRFNKESFKDLYNDYNGYLAARVCFEEGGKCTYNTYNVTTSVNGLYVVNNGVVSVSAHYHFSGVVRYYLIDGAGNQSETYQFTAIYQESVSDVGVVLKDSLGNLITEDKKYNKVVAEFDIANNSDTELRYALLDSKTDLNYEFANKTMSNAQFLSTYGFVIVNNDVVDITKASVDGSYCVWVYVSDALGNYKLFNVGVVIRLDTKVPTFDEMVYTIDRVADSSYELVVTNDMGNEIYIDVNLDGVFELVVLNDGKYSFNVSGVDSINLKLVDGASNVSEIKTIKLSEVSSDPYGRVYQNGNERKATVVVYNLGNKVLSFRYVVADINSSNSVYTDSYINGLEACIGDELYCIKTNYSGGNGVYNITMNRDIKVIFYITVGGSLIHDKNGNMLIVDLEMDDEKPIIEFASDNDSLISTRNGEYEFSLSVKDKHLSDLSNKKYILTKDSSIGTFDAYYNSCVGSNSCVRGVYDLDSSLVGNIVVNSNSATFANLTTGNYYIHTYIEDNYGNYSVARSASIYIDNEAPVVSYSSGTGSYIDISSEIFVGQATTLRFVDNKGIKYFDVLDGNNTVVVTCYVNDNSKNYKCDNNSYSQVGQAIYYELDTGNYRVVVYDVVNNAKEVAINVDSDAPVIKLYKKVGSDYVEQPGQMKTYNNLEDLYLKIVDDNFSYLVVDLINTITGNNILEAVRYSYNSDIGICLFDESVCANGRELKDILVTNAEYNKIVIKVYDKSNRYSSLEVNYDDIVPIIWTKDVGESISINGSFYTIEENMTMNFDIGVDSELTLDSLLNNVVISVDGLAYSVIKNNELFKVNVYQKQSGLYDNEFNLELFDYVGEYKVLIDYTDDALNKAVTKVIYINVLDNVKPSLDVPNINDYVQLNKEVEISPVVVRDNYGLDGNKVKEKYLYLENANSYTVDGAVCSDCFDKVRDGVYKFSKMGVYVFNYLVKDIADNENSVSYTFSVLDSEGPVMDTNEAINREIAIGNRNLDNSINVSEITIDYPVSYDYGEDSVKNVVFDGLYSLNNMNEKYKITDDLYLINDNGSRVVYKFTNIGTYYLRFMSFDSNGNTSVLDFEIKVVDKIAPLIQGVENNQKVRVAIDDDNNVDVETIILENGIKVIDNYDDNVKLNYVKNNDVIEFKAQDSSNNKTIIRVYLDIIDEIPPVAGALNVVSSSNLRELPFTIVGGYDNSSNWWHEYSIDGINWYRYNENSKLTFGEGLNRVITLCIRASDSSNKSAKVCKDITIDTSNPVVKGVYGGEIISSESVIQVEDNALASVELKFNGEMLFDINDLPFTVKEKGIYQLVAKDTMGNVTNVDFVIEESDYLEIVNDINAEEYVITSVDFEKRMLIKADLNYDDKGNSEIVVNLSSVNVGTNSMVYILGVVPNTDATFVAYSLNSSNISEYADGLQLIGDGNTFKDGVNNEHCLVKIGDSYYVYVAIKKAENNNTTLEVDGEEKNNDKESLLKMLLIGVGSFAVLFVGYQLIRLKRRVRAA